jgi:hypothetical protein
VIGVVIDAFGHRYGSSGGMKRGNILKQSCQTGCTGSHAACLNYFGGQRNFLKRTLNMVQILQLVNRKVQLDKVKSITKLWNEKPLGNFEAILLFAK